MESFDSIKKLSAAIPTYSASIDLNRWREKDHSQKKDDAVRFGASKSGLQIQMEEMKKNGNEFI